MLLKKMSLWILFILLFVLSGCQSDEKKVVIIDITEEEVEAIEETADKLREKPNPVLEEALLAVGLIAKETTDKITDATTKFAEGFQMQGVVFYPIEKREDLLKQMVEGHLSVAIVSPDLAAAMYNASNGRIKIVGQNIDKAVGIIENTQETGVADRELIPTKCLVIQKDMPKRQVKKIRDFLTDKQLETNWHTSKGYERDILSLIGMINRRSPGLIGGDIPNEDIFFKWKVEE